VADALTDGNIRVYSVPSIANIAAPTVAELNAGTDLTPLMTPDGLIGFDPDTAAVDNAKLNSTFNTQQPGRASWSGTALRLTKQVGTDTVHDTLIRGFATNIVVRRAGVAYATAFATSQKVEVYPSACGEIKKNAPEANATEKYDVPIFITSQPNIRATVA
jgi:hypothetical protein